ncbi:MAG: MFS transporter [Minisyncoccia bacterium]
MKRVINILSNNLYTVYILGFLFSLQVAIPAYVTSTFLSYLSSEQAVGLIYSFSALITLIAFFVIPTFLRRFGNYRTTLTLSIIAFLSLIGIVLSKDPVMLIMFFIINQISISLLSFSIDIFLEKYSANQATGQIRGFYLTSINMAWVLSPLVSAFLLTNNEYWKIFLISAIPLIPIILIIYFKFSDFSDPKYTEPSLFLAGKQIWNNLNLRRIYIINFLLRFFYTWMVIYTPIYLHNYIHLSWGQISIVLIFMLIPFVILDYPLGRLADKKLGEKEMLIAGLVIIALSTASLTFLNTTSMIILAVILFTTRIGAATIEMMTETYFFKKVNGDNANLISAYRSIAPLASVIAPLTATAFLLFFDLRIMFFVLGLIMLYGLRFAITLKDTK